MNFLLGANARMLFSTDPKVVFDALGPSVRALDWILANLECNYFPDGIRRTDEPQLLRGAELADLLDRESGNFQIIWGALVGLPPGIETVESCTRLDLQGEACTSIWGNPPRPQHPRSIVEVVCWDSTETVVFTRDESMAERFQRFFPEAVDLGEYNRRGAL